MINKKYFIRFSGYLSENMEFVRTPGWTTSNIAGRPKKGSRKYIIDLMDKDDDVILSLNPKVDFEAVCLQNDKEANTARVVAYIPYHSSGGYIVFRCGTHVIYKEKLEKDPPEIKITKIECDGRKVKLNWKADHSCKNALSFNVVYLVNRRRAFQIAKGVKKNKITFNLDLFPGGKKGRIAVLATDGARSAFDISKPIHVNNKTPELWIQRPGEGEVLPADQPVNLCGQAIDIAGASLADKGLLWKIDEEIVGEGQRVLAISGVEPGKHSLNLCYRIKNKIISESSFEFIVAKRSKDQDAFWKLIKRSE